MSKEQEYKAQMEALGVWDPAFAGAVHQLCLLERDQAKTRTAWRSALPHGDPKLITALSETLMQQDRAIQAMRESLCLTPRALQKLQKDFGAAESPEPKAEGKLTVLEQVRCRKEA